MGCVIALVLVNKHFDMFGQRRMFTCGDRGIDVTGQGFKVHKMP